MSSYISSNANRFYAGLESSYGQAATVTSANRFPAVKLHAHQALQVGRRYDKTGSRTYLGNSASSRRITNFEVQTYMTSWSGVGVPGYGPLFQAAFGGLPTVSSGLTIAATQGIVQMQTAAPHNLSFGSAVSYVNEVRFVTSVIDGQTFAINAPFQTQPATGSVLAQALTYSLATTLPSVSLFDYWDPNSSVSRLVVGAAVDMLVMTVNGDFHEFSFSGPASDLVDSASFTSGEGGIQSYPLEPALTQFDYSIVPGHLGEVWLGEPANQFLTLTGASIEVKNNIQMRNEEFGASYPRAISAAQRQVAAKFELYAQDDAQTVALYATAKQRSPIPAMLQLGQQQGQVIGVFIPNMMPEIPVFDDAEPRLKWSFSNNVAQGHDNDEIFIAFA